MTLSNRPKVILQRPGVVPLEYLSQIPKSYDDDLIVWGTDIQKALQFPIAEAFELSEQWSFLERCSVLPAPKTGWTRPYGP